MKKVLSLVLVIAMVLSSMSFAFASTFEDVADSDYEVAIETMKALGVINGYPDGTFRPEGILTRAELSKLLVEALGFGGFVGAASNFSDTNGHWADGNIAVAAGMGLVNGYPDGTFKPDATVSYEEAYTMVIRALGYTEASLRGTWPTNYMVKALDLGLTKGLALTSGPADRGGVAQVLYNALEAKFVQVDADNKITPVEEGAETLIDRLGEVTTLLVSLDSIDPDDKDYKGNVVDLTPYMYQTIKVYENKDGDVVYVKSVESLVIEGTVDDQTASAFKVEDAKEDVYTLAVGDDKNIEDGTPVLLNGEQVNYEDAGDLEGAEVTVVLEDEKDVDRVSKTVSQKVAGIIARLATETVQAEEDFDSKEEEVIAYPENVVLPLDDDEIDYDRVVVTGDADSLEDIEADDVLTLFYAKGEIDDDVKLEIVVSKETVKGTVTRISYKSSGDVDKVYIDGTSYSVFADYSDDVITVKDEGTFFLDYEGKIFAVQTESDINLGDYALVLSTTNGYVTTNSADEDVVLRDAKVKVLTAAGETVTYVLDHEDLPNSIVNDDLVVQLKEGDLIEYDLNKDKEIDEAAKVNVGSLRELKTNVNSFNLAKNAAIFSVPEYKDTDGAKVVDEDVLDDEIEAYVVRNDDKEIIVLIVVEGAGVEEKVYGIVTNNRSKVVDEDDEEVVLYTAYVDGVKVEYLGLADEDKITDLHAFAELTLSDGKLEEVDTVMSKIDKVSGKADPNARVTSSIKFDGEVAFLADDVVVYVIKTNGDFSKVGAKSDIRGNNFIAYDTVDEDGDVDVVVVYLGDLEDAEEAKITATFEAKYNTIAEKFAVAIDLSDVTMNDKVETVTIDGTEYEISTILEGRLLINGSFDAVPSEVVLVVDGEPITATNAK